MCEGKEVRRQLPLGRLLLILGEVSTSPPRRGGPWGSAAVVGPEAEREGFEDETLLGFLREGMDKQAWDRLVGTISVGSVVQGPSRVWYPSLG